MEEHEHEFVALKEFLSNLPILNWLVKELPLQLYLTVTNWEINTTLVKRMEKVQRLIYFINKVL